MSLNGYSDDDFDVGDDNNVTLISKLDVSHPLHLHPNDSVALIVVSVKLKGTENYQVWSFFYEGHGEADVILGIRIKHKGNGIVVSQSHYIKNVLKKFNYFNCTPVSTSIDTSEKLMPNNGHGVSQLEYSRYTSNHSTQHWQAIQRVLKYLNKTIDYGLMYTGCMDCGLDSEAEDGSDNGCLDCGSNSEAEDGSDNSMIVDEGEQDFTNPTDRRKFDLEDDQASLKLKDSNDETDAEALQVGDYHFFKNKEQRYLYIHKHGNH
ncbi:hypothetical protein Tco_0832993 [Tanacetum coccineum]